MEGSNPAPSHTTKCSRCPNQLPPGWKGTTCQLCRDKRKVRYAKEKASGDTAAIATIATVPHASKRPLEEATTLSEPAAKRALTDLNINTFSSHPNIAPAKDTEYEDDDEEDDLVCYLLFTVQYIEFADLE
jgi:hypothetical protein